MRDLILALLITLPLTTAVEPESKGAAVSPFSVCQFMKVCDDE